MEPLDNSAYRILTRPHLLTQTGMCLIFVSGHVVIDAAHRKRVKYEAKCANIRYGFLPFSFSSLGELEKDAVTILKRIRKFSMTQDIRACLDVCVDLTGSSPLTQTGMADFVPNRAVIDAPIVNVEVMLSVRLLI
ncbi:hypothetical protein Tco_0531230 [Tanacetum coccineum]